MPSLNLSRQENVFVLSLDNSAKQNTLTDDVLDEWHAALDEVENSNGNAALVITSSDAKIWSNGIDLDYVMGKGGENYLRNHFVGRVDSLLVRLAWLNLPTVGCITGHAFGGGALIASTLDFRTMRADKGFFCFPEVDIKLPFTPIMQACVDLLPGAALRWEMALTGKRVGGIEAAKGDIVNAALDEASLLPTTMGLAAQLAQKDRKTYTIIKRNFRSQWAVWHAAGKR